MNRTLLAALAVGALGAIGVAVLSPGEAEADRTIVLSTARSRITHGDFRLLADGGWRFHVCGVTEQTDGGTGLLERACVDCEPGAFAGGVATCRAEWRQANGL